MQLSKLFFSPPSAVDLHTRRGQVMGKGEGRVVIFICLFGLAQKERAKKKLVYFLPAIFPVFFSCVLRSVPHVIRATHTMQSTTTTKSVRNERETRSSVQSAFFPAAVGLGYFLCAFREIWRY